MAGRDGVEVVFTAEHVGIGGNRRWQRLGNHANIQQILGLVASLGAEAFLGARVIQATYRQKWSTKFPNPTASAVERHLFSASLPWNRK